MTTDPHDEPECSWAEAILGISCLILFAYGMYELGKIIK